MCCVFCKQKPADEMRIRDWSSDVCSSVLPSADPLAHPAYVWRGDGLTAARQFAPLPLAMLHGVEMQKAALIANLDRLAARDAAQDLLMWGARGPGKRALVQSAVAHVTAAGGARAVSARVPPRQHAQGEGRGRERRSS